MLLKRLGTNGNDVHLKVSAAASVVSQALGDLLQHVRQYTSRGEPIGRYDQATDTIMTVTESIFTSMGDAGESKRLKKRQVFSVRFYICELLLLLLLPLKPLLSMSCF